MRVRIQPGARLRGEGWVPGDKSIAHRWLILAATARGRSELRGLAHGLDVRSTASCMAQLSPASRPGLEVWLNRSGRGGPRQGQGQGFTWDPTAAVTPGPPVEVEAEGRGALEGAAITLDCGNSGTTMRLLAGLLSAAPWESVLVGDHSLAARPMERVAGPLRAMGADVRTTDGHAPVRVRGGSLSGVTWESDPPSAQVKSAVLLAGLAAEGETTVVEPVQTRDHTERALAALSAPIRSEPGRVSIGAFQHGGLEGEVPGDVSSAAFLVAAAALTRSALTIRGVGLNPTRTRFLDVMERMGAPTERTVEGDHLGEPAGTIEVLPAGDLSGTTVPPDELPLVIDEVPALSALAAHAGGDTRFAGAGELRLKESDRLDAIGDGIRALGGAAAVEGEDLVLAGGGLEGGRAEGRGDHRIAMALTVAALGSRGTCEVEGIESSEVTFPGFLRALMDLGADVEPA